MNEELYVLIFDSVYGREFMIFSSKKKISDEEWDKIAKEAFKYSIEKLLNSEYDGEIDSLTMLLNDNFVKNLVEKIEEKEFKLIFSTQFEGISKLSNVTIDVDIFNDRLDRFDKKMAERIIGPDLLKKLLEHNEKIRVLKIQELFFKKRFS